MHSVAYFHNLLRKHEFMTAHDDSWQSSRPRHGPHFLQRYASRAEKNVSRASEPCNSIPKNSPRDGSQDPGDGPPQPQDGMATS